MRANSSSQRRRVLYAGNVQGVGFRFTSQRIAQGFAVTGFVRNLSNGSVELVAEGPPSELNRFLAQVAATMGDCIQDTDIHCQAATGEFASFVIAY